MGVEASVGIAEGLVLDFSGLFTKRAVKPLSLDMGSVKGGATRKQA